MIFSRSFRISDSVSNGAPVSDGDMDGSVFEGSFVVSVSGSVGSSVALVSSVEGAVTEADVISLSFTEEVLPSVSGVFAVEEVPDSALMEKGSAGAVSSFSFFPAHPVAKALFIIIPSRITAAILFLFIHPYLLLSKWYNHLSYIHYSRLFMVIR